MSYFHTYRLPVCITRCGNFYGGGDLNMNRLVPGTVRAVLRRQRPVIRSDGSYLRDYFYVKDGAEAYLHLAECLGRRPELAGEAFNFSPESQISVLEITTAIQRLMRREDLSPDIRDQVRAEIKDQYLDSTRARQRLGWTARHTLDNGLAKTIEWYRGFLEGAASRPAASLRAASAAGDSGDGDTISVAMFSAAARNRCRISGKRALMARSKSPTMVSTRAALTVSSKSMRTVASTSCGPRCMVRMVWMRRMAPLFAASRKATFEIPSTKARSPSGTRSMLRRHGRAFGSARRRGRRSLV
jgi:hypothetical protein